MPKVPEWIAGEGAGPSAGAVALVLEDCAKEGTATHTAASSASERKERDEGERFMAPFSRERTLTARIWTGHLPDPVRTQTLGERAGGRRPSRLIVAVRALPPNLRRVTPAQSHLRAGGFVASHR